MLPSDRGIFGPAGDVSPWDVRFDPFDRAHVETARDGRVRLRVAAEPALTEATLVLRTSGVVVAHPMEDIVRTSRFVFWEVSIDRPPEGSAFSFALRAPNGRGVYVVPSGVSNAVERLDRWPLRPPPPLDVPEWAEGAVIYQIFPDRFARGGRGGPSFQVAWDEAPDPHRRHGGDLEGIRDRLDHLQDLGVDVLYLNPIFTSPSNHRYDTIDYYAVDPDLGGNEALAALVDDVHGRGMRIILDTSLNHVHPRFFAFADLVRRGPESLYREWFTVREWPLRIKVRPRPGGRWTSAEWLDLWREQVGVPVDVVDGDGPEVEPSYEAWYSVPTMPRVDLSNQEARRYMLDVAAHWVREYDIDGWRMDVVRYVDRDFWPDFRAAVRSVRPDAYLVCEVMGDARSWLQGDQFDATMNYTFRELAVRFFATSEIDGAGLLDGAGRLLAMYARPVTLANQNLIGSHDTSRFLTRAGGELWRLRLATVFQLTFPGAPGIYYGDEVGLTGADDPGSRGAFPWEGDVSAHPVAAAITELAALRRSEPALRLGSFRPVAARGGLFVFERALGERRVLVALNRSARRARLDIEPGGRVAWGDGAVADGELTVRRHGAVVVVR